MPAGQMGVKRRRVLEDDTERQVERTSRTHERARELQVGSGVDEKPESSSPKPRSRNWSKRQLTMR